MNVLVAGLGAVIRDSERKFIAVAHKQNTYYRVITAVEAEAIKMGIETTISIDYMPLIIEFDYKDVVNLVVGRNVTKQISSGSSQIFRKG